MKICFVVMGFGKKMDYQTGKTVDLDLTYNKVIKPLFGKNALGYEVVRGDEILSSSLIDVDMYQYLLNADLVIADITTMNANALYELGVRHALRPASTIIIAQKMELPNVKSSYPFDINHCRVFPYENLREDHDGKRAEHIQSTLKRVILSCDREKVDSPIYTYLKGLQPPVIAGNAEGKMDLNKTSKIQKVVELIHKAQTAVTNSQFEEAISLWKEVHKVIPNYPYVIQQLALSTYKSKQPSEKAALEKAWQVIKKLPIDSTLDAETLGIAGAICKRMYQLPNSDIKWLDNALRYYQKGFINSQDYYTGENYANCLLLKLQQTGLTNEEKAGLNYERKNTCRAIICILKGYGEKRQLGMWELASMSNCYLHLGQEENAREYEKKFLQKTSGDWQKESFNKTKKEILDFLSR